MLFLPAEKRDRILCFILAAKAGGGSDHLLRNSPLSDALRFMKSQEMKNSSNRSRSASGDHIRVLIVDDHPAIREALADTIDSKIDMEVCGETNSSDEAFHLVEKLEPDVAVVDISLDDAHGLDLVQNIRAQYPDTQVVVFSMYDEQVYAERAIRAGASGYLMKSEPTQSVVDAIRNVNQGEVHLSRRMASHILNKVALGRSSSPQFAIDELTDREMAVFQMLGEGYTVDEIKERLNLSRKTVETYRRRAKEKFGFDSVAELLQYAVQWTYGQATGQKSDAGEEA